PPAARLDIVDANQWLRTHSYCPHSSCNGSQSRGGLKKLRRMTANASAAWAGVLLRTAPTVNRCCLCAAAGSKPTIRIARCRLCLQRKAARRRIRRSDKPRFLIGQQRAEFTGSGGLSHPRRRLTIRPGLQIHRPPIRSSYSPGLACHSTELSLQVTSLRTVSAAPPDPRRRSPG